MFYPLNDRQARFLAIAQELATRFAERAAEYDRSGAFPHENYADVRASGLPALVVPKRLGGWGANLYETAMVLETLAMGDGSTALNISMHMQTLGSVVEKRAWPEPMIEQVCRDAVKKGALINAVATEPELGSPSRGGKPKTIATPVREDGELIGWTINGLKSFASMSPTLDYMIVPATLQDGSEDVARFVVPVGEGVEIIETWDAMGMRTTGSHDVRFRDVWVPEGHMIDRSDSARPGGGAKPGAGKVNAWFAVIVSAVYVGVARAAQKAAVRYAQERVPTALGKPIAELEGIQHRLGRVELLLDQARTLIYHFAAEWDRAPDRHLELGPGIAVTKFTATNNAVDAVDHCMRVVGGASMAKSLPLERYYRDVRAGLSHPVNDDQTLIMLGKLSLERQSPAVG